MSTLIHVQAALKSNDIKRANQLLKVVLKDSPCADAWYIAARLTHKPFVKAKYLRRALALNPNHKPSQKMMAQLPINHEAYTLYLFKKFVNMPFMQSLKQRYDDLTHRQHILLLGSLASIMTAIIGIILLFAVAPQVIELPEVKAFSYVNIDSTDTMASHLANNLVNVGWVHLQPIPAGIHAGQYIEASVTDSQNNNHLVQILVYKHYSSLANDIGNIEVFRNGKVIHANKNSLLIYPTNLSEDTATDLLEAYQTMPTIEIDPRQS